MEESNEFEEGNVGFVTILGRPNVGKSSFLNKALRYHLTAVSRRPNTTRKRWLGILSGETSQIVFADTPGVHSSRNKMQEAMAGSVRKAIEGNDAVLCLCDPTRAFGDEDRRVAALAKESGKTVFLAINKVDLAKGSQIEAMRAAYTEAIGACEVHKICALTGEGLDELVDRIRASLPVGPFLFPSDQLTDVIERDIAAELIREAANELVYQELPQSITVSVDTWKETDKKIRIDAVLYVEREAQKAIAIGEKGSMTKRIIKNAREKLREDLGKFVDVRLSVKVAPDWQNRKRFLEERGVVDSREK